MSQADSNEKEKKNRELAARCWRTGNEALAKQNWDYSVEMYSTSVKLAPDVILYRQSLRGAEGKKYNNNKTGSRMAFMSMSGIKSRLKKAMTAKNWLEADQIAEEGLRINPWDTQLNADLGESCKQRGLDEIAVLCYEKAVEADPKSPALLRGLADAYERRGNYTNAVKCWERISAMDPLDGEARSKISGLAASETMDRGGYEKAETSHEVQQGYEERVTKARDAVIGPGVSQEEDLKRACRKDPSKESFLKLADYYRQKQQFAEAAAAFYKAFEITGDPNAREQSEDMDLESQRRNLDLAKQTFQRNPNDQQAKENAIGLAKDLLSREVEIMSLRMERYPMDLKLKSELAARFMRQKKYSAAIPLLQQAAQDAKTSGTIFVSLGECFVAEKKNDLARRQFEKALERLNAIDNSDAFKKCHYMLGRLYEEAGKKEKAEYHYTEIIGVDYDYKDARDRLEKIQGTSDEEAEKPDDDEEDDKEEV